MTIGKFEVALLIVAAIVTTGYILEDYADKKYEHSEDKVFEVIDYDIKTLSRVSWMISHYELAVSNSENFEKQAANGTVHLRLLGEDFEVEIHETSVETHPIYPTTTKYQGKVVGMSDSEASFSVTNKVIYGNIDTGKEHYSIQRTSGEYEGQIVQVIFSSEARQDFIRRKEIESVARIMVDLRPKYLEGELNFTVTPEKTKVLENENFKIHLSLRNVGEKTINVWEMAEQISYDIYFYDPNGTKASYSCGVISRTPLTNENLVELHPGQSLNTTFNSKCWDLKEGEYTLNAVYHTFKGEMITKPYWVGEVQSNNVTVVVE